MNTTIKRHEDHTIELTFTIPWSDIHVIYDQVVDDLAKEAEIQGFRKGKAPRNVVEKNLDKSKTYEEVMQRIIPKFYSDVISKEGIHPIVMPKITLLEAKEGSDWNIAATTCEKPDVELGDYRKAISDLRENSTKKIWVPGQEQKKDEEKNHSVPLEKILNAIFSQVQTSLPAVLVEQEVNRLLSDLVDQTKRLGLTVEQYLTSTNRTAETLRVEYQEQAKRTLTLEFALEAIAEKEAITVSNDEITEVIKKAKTDDERNAMENQRYYLASILRRQKTIDQLAKLTERV